MTSSIASCGRSGPG
ncbi:hypothetical protein [uncultured Thermus sp.]